MSSPFPTLLIAATCLLAALLGANLWALRLAAAMTAADENRAES